MCVVNSSNRPLDDFHLCLLVLKPPKQWLTFILLYKYSIVSVHVFDTFGTPYRAINASSMPNYRRSSMLKLVTHIYFSGREGVGGEGEEAG